MAYSFQTFAVGQVLTAAQISQTEVNIRDHVHGQDGVSAVHGSMTILGSGLAVGSVAPVGLGTVNVNSGYHVGGVNILAHRGALAVSSVNQALPNNVDTLLICGVVTYNTASCVNVSSRAFVVTTGTSVVVVRASAHLFDGVPANEGFFNLTVLKNGSSSYPGAGRGVSSVASQAIAFQAEANVETAAIPVSSGDYFQVRAYHSTGGTVNIIPGYTWMAITVLQ